MTPPAASTPQLARITLYPLKSFDPLSVPVATVLPSGALKHDRQFALVQTDGRLLTAKLEPQVHRVAIRVDPVARTASVCLRAAGGEADGATGAAKPPRDRMHLDHDRAEFERCVSQLLGRPLRLIENTSGGFPDDEEAPGPTIVSTASLQTVASWFPGCSIDTIRERFRANLEVESTDAFWEDRLFGSESSTVPFRVGTVRFEGTTPCQRCVVPSRDPRTGLVWPNFAKTLSALREQSLPAHAARDRFTHCYRLATNTRGAGVGGAISVGDFVCIDS